MGTTIMALSLFSDRFFDDIVPRMETREMVPRLGACDIQETPNAHVLHFDAPGMKNDDVHIELKDGNMLHISGERKASHEDDQTDDSGVKWHRIERSFGKFQRAFKLPDDSDLDHINAKCDNGELVITVPKQEQPVSK